MSGFGLGWRNYVLTEEDDLALLSGAVVAGELSALRDMRLSRRCTLAASREDAGVASIVLAWERAGGAEVAVPVGMVGILNYGVSAPDALTVSWRAVIYAVDSGTLTPVLEVWERPSEDFPAHLLYMLDAQLPDSYEVRLIVEAEFGSGGGALSITAGGLWVGPVWAPPDGLEATWTHAVIDPGQMGRSIGGQGYPRRRQRIRTFEGRAVHVPRAWAFGDALDASILDIQQMLYRVGTTEPIILLPRTRDETGQLSTHLIHRLGIYGHFAEDGLGRIEHLGGDLYQWTGARVEELL